MQRLISSQGHVAIAAPVKETNDAQLSAQSAHAPDQTGQRSRLLHCDFDLADPPLPLWHPDGARQPAPFFMKFRGPQALSNRPQTAMVCPTRPKNSP